MSRSTCSICHAPITGGLLDAGGDLGTCHRSCFEAFDRLSEAEELTAAACCAFLGALLPVEPGATRVRRAA